jgi:hypothetical protein
MSYRFLSLAFILPLLFIPLHAGLLTETLQNVTFYDGGVANGSFTFDSATSTITNWSISVSGGDTVSFPALTYDTLNSVASAGLGDLGLPRFLFEVGGNRHIALLLEDPLPLSGGSDPFHIWPDGEPSHSGGFECLNCAPFRNFATGSLEGEVVVPEPGVAVLTGLGVLVIGLKRRTRT